MQRKAKSILVVDDEVRMADSLRDLLRSASYEAASVHSGRAAVERLRQVAFQVVITDLRMEGMGGIDLIRHIQENYPRILVIVITGHASTESAIEAVHLNVLDYLRKPFAFDLLKATVEKAYQRLETDQLREDTAAMISHDIKIPLTSIIGFASMLYDKGKGQFHPRAADFAETIEANGQKILDLVENYLATCRIEGGSLRTALAPVDLRALVHDLLSMAMFSADRRRCEIAVRIAKDLPSRVALDETLTYRAVSNLLSNAIKYHAGGDPILLEVAEVAPGATPLGVPAVRIAVENRADGLDPAALPALFHRFQRGAMSRGIEGSGIGLYVVDAAVKAQNGYVGAEMPDPDTVRFFFDLPLLPAPDAAPLVGPIE